MKIYNKIAFLLFFLAAMPLAQAQVGFGTETPHKSSVVDMESSKRGLLIPRLELTATNVADPVTSPAESLLVYNTATDGTGETAVTPGYYYWKDNAWHRLLMDTDLNLDDAGIEPWFKQGTSEKAKLNTDDIYQSGRVSIKGNAPIYTGSAVQPSLYVHGAIRGGQVTAATASSAGAYSIAVGNDNIASGSYSAAFGEGISAIGEYTTALGLYNLGLSNTLLEVGNGVINGDKANAFTILEDGKISIGMDGASATPTEQLDVMEGKVRVRDLPTTTANNDYVVLADADGVLNSVEESKFTALPRYFYMPSVIVPTHDSQISQVNEMHALGANSNEFYSHSGGVYTMNIYNMYKAQFEGSKANSVSSNASANPANKPDLFTFQAAELIYNITWFDARVFDDVQVTDQGVLTYKIKSGAPVTFGSFMNIVLEVKQD